MNNTIDSTHGHEVMHMIADHGPLSRADLANKVSAKFGETALFHTCSAQGMNLEQLLVFLLDRSKINEGPNGLFMGDGQHTCDHE